MVKIYVIREVFNRSAVNSYCDGNTLRFSVM